VAALVRGDRDLNEIKLKNALGAIDLAMATAEQVQTHTGAPVGFAGPIGLKDVTIFVDSMVAEMTNFVVGANQFEKHIVDANINRDFKPEKVIDLTLARDGDGCPQCGGSLTAKRGIELGNTFMLGTKYSNSLGAKFLDADGKEHPLIMGSYGIGITRTPQAALEKYFDDKGIVWPKNIAPYLVEIIPLNFDKPTIREAAEQIYADLHAAGIDALLDDRDERAGVKFNDADLIGMPIRITIGDKSLKDGKVELKARCEAEVSLVPLGGIVAAVRGLEGRLT
jgi:prolyl-tRNA synthetase